MTYKVYTLKCPTTGAIKYIGVTNNVSRRFSEHLSRVEDTEKYRWINSLKENGLKPICEILEETEYMMIAFMLEEEYIKSYKALGHPIFNITDGGKNPPTRSGYVYTRAEKDHLANCSTRKKRVAQLDKYGNVIEWFNGVREAGRKTGIDHRSISQVAAGSKIRKSAGGFNWKYV